MDRLLMFYVACSLLLAASQGSEMLEQCRRFLCQLQPVFSGRLQRVALGVLVKQVFGPLNPGLNRGFLVPDPGLAFRVEIEVLVVRFRRQALRRVVDEAALVGDRGVEAGKAGDAAAVAGAVAV